MVGEFFSLIPWFFASTYGKGKFKIACRVSVSLAAEYGFGYE